MPLSHKAVVLLVSGSNSLFPGFQLAHPGAMVMAQVFGHLTLIQDTNVVSLAPFLVLALQNERFSPTL